MGTKLELDVRLRMFRILLGVGAAIYFLWLLGTTLSSIERAIDAEASAIQAIQIYSESLFWGLVGLGVVFGLYVLSRAFETWTVWGENAPLRRVTAQDSSGEERDEAGAELGQKVASAHRSALRARFLAKQRELSARDRRR